MSSRPRVSSDFPSPVIKFPDHQANLPASLDTPPLEEQSAKLDFKDHLMGGIGLAIVISIMVVDAYLILRDMF